MERLTTISGKRYTVKTVSEIPSAIRKLAYYEDAEEQGTLVRLPCKIGDIVYQLDRTNHKILTQKVIKIDLEISGEKSHTMQIWFATAGSCFGSQFGKTVFHNKAEAMKALESYLGRGSE